jgi:eukaryotic-like serine/threonine-protein kinase
MPQACPSCGASNDSAAEVCFTCRAVLTRITLGSVIAGRYEMRKLLGRGGMGTVYLAHDRSLEEVVALKILRGDLAESAHIARRFLSEIKLARLVTHANVCRIHDYGEDGQIHYISMELIDGPDLKHVLGARGAVPTAQAYEIAIQLVEGLDAIHRVGIVHRDIKTRNIMLDAGGVVKLMDFGIAKRVGHLDPGTTAAGAILGTPEYMSPEQARGERTDGRSDIYAVGIVVYEIFTGVVPFKSDTAVQVLLKQMHAPPPLDGPMAERLPPPLVAVLHRMLAKEPGQRFVTAAEAVEALRTARDASLPEGAPPPSLIELAVALSPIRALGRAGAGDVAPGAETESWVVPRASEGHAPPATAGRAGPRPRRWKAAALTALGLGAGAFWLAAGGPAAAPAAAPAVLSPPPTTSAQAPPLMEAPPATSPPSAVPPTLPREPRRRSPPPPRASAAEAAASREETAAIPSVAPPAPVASAGAAEVAFLPQPLPTASPAVAADAEPLGLLQIGVRPYADVLIDGTPVGTTPFKAIALPPGTHTVVLMHPGYRPLKRSVKIVAGQRAKVFVDLPLDGIRE